MKYYISLALLVVLFVYLGTYVESQQVSNSQRYRVVRNRQTGERIFIVNNNRNNANNNRNNRNNNRTNNNRNNANNNRNNANNNRNNANNNRNNANNNRNNANNNRNGNNGNNGNTSGRIILGTPGRNVQQRQPATPGRTNIVAIILRHPSVNRMLRELAQTVMAKLKAQDMMFLIAGIDGKERRSTRAMKAMFTGTKEKSMAMGEEERAKTEIVKEMTKQMNITSMEAANSVDDLLDSFGINLKGLTTRDDNCDQFVQVRCDRFAKYRTMDGSCNNLNKPLWGRSFIPMRRFVQPAYDDGVSAPRTKSVTGGELPSARRVSLTIHESDQSRKSNGAITHMVMQWGQFLDHDITSTPTSSGAEGANVGCCSDDASSASMNMVDMRPEDRDICFPIRIDGSDPQFGHRSCMSFIRSIQVSNTNCTIAPAEQLNQITAFIDGSGVYGSSEGEAQFLRTFSGGLLKTSVNGLLPEDDHPSCVRTTPRDFCFLAGDTRVNEQMGLATMHTVFMREHNRMARELSRLNPSWNDETLFQETRRIVAAKIQHITYGEFMDQIMRNPVRNKFGLRFTGPAIPREDPYDPNVDASIRNGFATAAYRFGHTLVRSMFSQMDTGYRHLEDLPLVSSFGNTSHLIKDNGAGVSRYVRGLVSDEAGQGDRFMSPQITQQLFEDGLGHSLDLAALNIQRGRDHGLPGYNEWRRWCKLKVAGSFDDLEDMRPAERRRLQRLYDNVDDIDLFAGGLSEKREPLSLVGPTFSCILAHQFKALKVGDRFWYERNDDNTGFSRQQVRTIKRTTLARLLCDNTDIIEMQPKAFQTVIKKNQRVRCEELRQEPLFAWSLDAEVRKQANPQREDPGNRFVPQTTTQAPGSAEWGPWGQYGECANGKQFRQRVCQTTGNAQPTCVGPSSDSKVCRTNCSRSIYNIFSKFMC